MSKKLIVGNWKMNPATRKDAGLLARAVEAGVASLRNVETVVVPPAPFLESIGGALKKVKLGAQNVFWENAGPYTGEVSVLALKDLGVQYIIIGHSERRHYFQESDEMIKKKTQKVLESGLSAIICIGERMREEGEIPQIVRDQIVSALKGVKKQFLKNCIIAYEPVWAISTNPNAKADTPDSAFRACLFIRKVLTDLYDRAVADAIPILYGGSVRRSNIEAFLMEGKMQGALVGGASLDSKEFVEIVKIASRVKSL